MVVIPHPHPLSHLFYLYGMQHKARIDEIVKPRVDDENVSRVFIINHDERKIINIQPQQQ